MKYKNNITYKDEAGDTKHVNFKTRQNMINHLEKNKHKLSKLKACRVNFGSVSLSIKDTVWFK